MPIYEYECPKCSGRFEQKRSFTDESPAVCPKCQTKSRRVFSPVPIIFKGSGFYVNDYKADHGHSAPSGASDQSASADAAKTKDAGVDKAKTKAAVPDPAKSDAKK